MTQSYDNLSVGDFVSSEYMKNLGDVNSRALEVLYTVIYESSMRAQDPGVKNAGVNDDSQVFKVEVKNNG